jgi:prolyl-tRNA synthetase
MTHSDDDGLIVPPKIAYYHVVICPILMKNSDHSSILSYCQKVADSVSQQHYDNQPIRVFIDSSDKSGGEKNWHWVKKGVPVRIEIGAKEVTADTVSLKKRCVSNKAESYSSKDLGSLVSSILEETQNALFQRASNRLHEAMNWCHDQDSIRTHFRDHNAGFALTYWHQDDAVEQKLKEELSVTIRCYPRETLMDKELEGPCFFDNSKTGKLAILGRAY